MLKYEGPKCNASRLGEQALPLQYRIAALVYRPEAKCDPELVGVDQGVSVVVVVSLTRLPSLFSTFLAPARADVVPLHN